MREQFVTVNVGKCGINMGLEFWKGLCQEHRISEDGSGISSTSIRVRGSKVFFRERENGIYVPRSVFMDLEKGDLDKVRSGKFRKLFDPNNYCCKNIATNSNWGIGHYSVATDPFLECLRKEIETCDNFGGLIMNHSICGGTGGGLGTIIGCKYYEEYRNRILASNTVINTESFSNGLEIYNQVLSLNYLIENFDFVTLYDNKDLERRCLMDFRIKDPTFDDLNQLMARISLGYTSTFRLSGKLNSSFRKIVVNLVPFYRKHFLFCGISPFTIKDVNLSVPEIVRQASLDNVICQRKDDFEGLALTEAVTVRGRLNSFEVEKHNLKEKKKFVTWIPRSFHLSYVDIPPEGFKCSATSLLNDGLIFANKFKKLHDVHAKMFKRKYLLNYFTSSSVGMDEMEFTESECNVSDIIDEYRPSFTDRNEDDDELSSEEEYL